MTTTQEPENDPKLELLLVDSLRERANKAVIAYSAMKTKMSKDLIQQAAVLARLFLEANPGILKFGFETTEGEFNDNGYDGYTINDEPVYMHAKDLHLPEVTYSSSRQNEWKKTPTGEHYCTYMDHDECDNHIEPDEWDYDKSMVDIHQGDIVATITHVLYAVTDTLADEYGVGLLYFDKNGMYVTS